MSSARRTQRSEWKDFLEALPYFANVPVVAEDVGDVQAEYDKAIAAMGVCVILMTVKFAPTKDAEAGPVITYFHAAHVVENVLFNRDTVNGGTGKTRDEVIEKICGYTHANFQALSATGPFMLSGQAIKIDDDSGLPSEDCMFEVPASFGLVLDQVATPVISRDPNTGLVTITCATPGAAVFVTVDNTRPGPRKTLYTAPFTPDSGVMLRVRAWLAGYLASEIATLQIPT
jgi:hypothetical protein